MELFALVGAVVLILISAIWGGFVLQQLWGWFVIPIFGLPALTLPGAIGLALVVGFLTYQRIREPKDERSPERALLESIFYAIFNGLFVLVIGWIVQLFI